jgi:dTMP kinase
MRGKFITLEGMDGAGKSSHVTWIADWLRGRGIRVLVTREPGGTPVGERLRELILKEPMDLRTEALLVFAARQEHLVRAILPALEAGQWVLSDRFTDATYAYQGGGRGLARSELEILEGWVHRGFQPDLTMYFDLPVEAARARLSVLQAELDRFEREGVPFFERVRDAYLVRARQHPARIKVIDASPSLDEVKNSVEGILLEYCNK